MPKSFEVVNNLVTTRQNWLVEKGRARITISVCRVDSARLNACQDTRSVHYAFHVSLDRIQNHFGVVDVRSLVICPSPEGESRIMYTHVGEVHKNARSLHYHMHICYAYMYVIQSTVPY